MIERGHPVSVPACCTRERRAGALTGLRRYVKKRSHDEQVEGRKGIGIKVVRTPTQKGIRILSAPRSTMGLKNLNNALEIGVHFRIRDVELGERGNDRSRLVWFVRGGMWITGCRRIIGTRITRLRG